MYIQTDGEGRVLGWSRAPGPDFPHEVPDDLLDWEGDYDDWVWDGSGVAFSERGEHRREREELEAMERGAELLGGLAGYQSDTDAALCAVYEDTGERLADIEAALCELYEAITEGR